MSFVSRYLPFSATTTPFQAATYLLGISLFSISFLVFLNSSVSFVITDLLGVKQGVGDIVGTLGFVDEVVALVACPVWGLVSDRLGVRWVAVLGYIIIGASLMVFVAARNVYPQLVLARIFFALGATASATMVTAILPSLTDDGDSLAGLSRTAPKPVRNGRNSIAVSLESDATITPERYTRLSTQGGSDSDGRSGKPSVLAGYVGLFTGCGALVALSLFLPLPARFGEIEGVTPAQAVTYSFYVVGVVAFLVALFVSFGLRDLQGEDGKGWRVLLGLQDSRRGAANANGEVLQHQGQNQILPYLNLLRDSVALGFTDSHIALGYLGGFVARASTVAISLFVPLFINTFFMERGQCLGSPHDPSPELKKECRAAYLLASILTGVAQLMGLICAPLFGYLARRPGRINFPVLIATLFGIIGYAIFPNLASPEPKNTDGRGGSPVVFLVVTLLGISQIGAIVCSLGSLGRGVLTADLVVPARRVGASRGGEENGVGEEDAVLGGEGTPLLGSEAAEAAAEAVSRVRLKGSIAGVYSWCGGAAILLLTKLGGFLFDKWTHAAPFYMMAMFNAILLVASVAIDVSKLLRKKTLAP